MEAALRVANWEIPKSDTMARDDRGTQRYALSPTGLGDLIPDQDGYWTIWFHRPYHVETNSAGLRNTEELSPDSMRILAIGDSMTFGPYLANEDTWPAWLENRLRNTLDGKLAVQVLNAGIAGYSIVDEFEYLKDKGVKLAPDMVVLGIFENDITGLRREKLEKFGRNKLMTTVRDEDRYAFGNIRAFLGQYSALYNLVSTTNKSLLIVMGEQDIRQADERRNTPGDRSAFSPDMDALEAEYLERLTEMARFLGERNVPLVIVHIPSKSYVLRSRDEIPPDLRAARAVTADTESHLIELWDVYREAGGADAVYLLMRDPDSGKYEGNGHLSRFGGKTTGEAVADWLLARGLIRPKM